MVDKLKAVLFAVVVTCWVIWGTQQQSRVSYCPHEVASRHSTRQIERSIEDGNGGWVLPPEATTILPRAHAASGQIPVMQSVSGSAYQPDAQTSAWRSGLSAADTKTFTAYLALSEFVLGDTSGARSNVSVGARFTNNSQTCKFRLLYVWKNGSGTNTAYGLSDEFTLTGSDVQDASNNYVAPTVVLDSFGARTIRVALTTAPVGGTVDLWVGSY